MPTWNQIADDVLIAMGYSHDDALRNRPQVQYNATLIYNKLKNQQLKKNAKTGDSLAIADMLHTYIVPVVHNNVADNVVNDWDASYFDLPSAIMNMDAGAALNMVRYLRNDLPANCPPAVARTPFSQTTLASLYNLYQSKYQAPRSDRPYVARAKAGSADRVYLFGVPSSVTHLLVALYTAASFMDIDPDEEIDLPDHLLATMKKMMLEMESWLLQIPQERLMNEGRDFPPGQTVQTRPAISVNDPAQFDD